MPTAILAFASAVSPEDAAGVGVEIEPRSARVEDAILAAVGTEVSILRVVVAAGRESMVWLTAATIFAFEPLERKHKQKIQQCPHDGKGVVIKVHYLVYK